jgi:hypothetical protein
MTLNTMYERGAWNFHSLAMHSRLFPSGCGGGVGWMWHRGCYDGSSRDYEGTGRVRR